SCRSFRCFDGIHGWTWMETGATSPTSRVPSNGSSWASGGRAVVEEGERETEEALKQSIDSFRVFSSDVSLTRVTSWHWRKWKRWHQMGAGIGRHQRNWR